MQKIETTGRALQEAKENDRLLVGQRGGKPLFADMHCKSCHGRGWTEVRQEEDVYQKMWCECVSH
jgi:hypothetical protein